MPTDEETDSTEAFVENVPLTDVFGLHPKTRIVATMLTQDDDDLTAFTENEISRIGGLDEEEVSKYINELQEYGIVTETTDDISETLAYQLNHENRVVNVIFELNENLTDQGRTE